eukprot:978732-Rhodomonas_salina.1
MLLSRALSLWVSIPQNRSSKLARYVLKHDHPSAVQEITRTAMIKVTGTLHPNVFEMSRHSTTEPTNKTRAWQTTAKAFETGLPPSASFSAPHLLLAQYPGISNLGTVVNNVHFHGSAAQERDGLWQKRKHAFAKRASRAASSRSLSTLSCCRSILWRVRDEAHALAVSCHRGVRSR